MLERTIENYTRNEIAKLGGFMEKFISPGNRGRPDDIVFWPEHSNNALMFRPYMEQGAIRKAQVEFIEFKSPTGVLKALQKLDHARRRHMGFLVHVIGSMDEANEYLKSRGKKDALGLPGNRAPKAKKAPALKFTNDGGTCLPAGTEKLNIAIGGTPHLVFRK